MRRVSSRPRARRGQTLFGYIVFVLLMVVAIVSALVAMQVLAPLHVPLVS